MALTQVIHLTQETYGLPPIVHMVQNDTGRELMMVIDDVELSGSPTAVLYWMRSDLTHYSTNAEFDSQNNAFTADVSQALTQPFNTQCQLKVTDSNDVIVSTYTFIIDVQTDVDGTSEAQLGYSIEEITEIIDAVRSGALTEDVKQALLNCFEHVAWTDEHGQDYVDALEAALYPPATLVSITAVYTQSGTVYDTDSLDSLKPDLVVTAHFDDGSTSIVSDGYVLSGTLAGGESTITVTFAGKSTTFTVDVYQPAELVSIAAVYTQSGTVYDTSSLDDLKSDLVVTGTYDDESTAEITAYTLSGTLTPGTSTILVTYGNFTTSFTVSVTSWDIVEFSASWFVENTTDMTKWPRWYFNTPQDAGENWPDVLCIVCEGTNNYGLVNSTGKFQTRTGGWTRTDYKFCNPVTEMEEVTVGTKTYFYLNITKSAVTTAYEDYTEAIAGGQISVPEECVILLNQNSNRFTVNDLWLITEEMTAENAESIISRLPDHT